MSYDQRVMSMHIIMYGGLTMRTYRTYAPGTEAKIFLNAIYGWKLWTSQSNTIKAIKYTAGHKPRRGC